MVSYATIEEAWSTSGPPAQYPASAPFDVSKSGSDANFCRPDQVESALESAYPAGDSAPYDRMYSRSGDTLKKHAPRPDACPPAGAMDEGEPDQMYGRDWPLGSGVGGGHAGHEAQPSQAAVPTSSEGAPRGYGDPVSDERGSLHDILVFLLFGLLLVLAMHEISSLSELLGRQRAMFSRA